jgi:hypothetical protein
MERMRRLARGREHGQSIVFFAFFTIFILGVVAIVVESSAVYIQRRNLQNAADAAALAGAQSLDGTISSETLAEGVALTYKNDNITSTTYFLAEAQSSYTDIEVTVKKKSATAFAGWMSFGEPEVTAKAKARIASPLLPGPGVVPLGIDAQTYNHCIVDNECEDVTMKEYSGNNDDPPSSYGLLDLGGTGGGANEVCEYLVGGATVQITDPDNLKSGNVSSLHNCLINRYNAANATGGTHAPRCVTWEDVTDNDVLIDACNPLSGAKRGADSNFPVAQPTMAIVIPVVVDFDQTGCDTNPKCFDIVGSGDQLRTFAIFLIDQSTVLGDDPTCNVNGQCWITGRFIREWKAPVSTNFDVPTGTYNPNALLKIVQLID